MYNIYLQGRVVASGPEEAIEAIRDILKQKGYEAERVTAHPCLVQPYPPNIWVEWLARVRSVNLSERS